MMAPYLLSQEMSKCVCAQSLNRVQFFFVFFSIYFYQLEANYLTILQQVLSYIDMNQPWSYMYSLQPPQTGFPHNSGDKESACNAGDLGSIPGLGRSPGEGKGYPFQYSVLENSMDTVHGVAKSQTQLSDFYFHFHRLQPLRLLCPWDFPGTNTGVGCHILLQGISLTQESNLCFLCLLHWE